MKQGQASHSGSAATKVEPKSQAVNPAGVAQLGSAVDPRAVENIHQGRGLKAPMMGESHHQAGSQGRHK